MSECIQSNLFFSVLREMLLRYYSLCFAFPGDDKLRSPNLLREDTVQLRNKYAFLDVRGFSSIIPSVLKMDKANYSVKTYKICSAMM